MFLYLDTLLPGVMDITYYDVLSNLISTMKISSGYG